MCFFIKDLHARNNERKMPHAIRFISNVFEVEPWVVHESYYLHATLMVYKIISMPCKI